MSWEILTEKLLTLSCSITTKLGCRVAKYTHLGRQGRRSYRRYPGPTSQNHNGKSLVRECKAFRTACWTIFQFQPCVGCV